jgi:hypothetical protein
LARKSLIGFDAPFTSRREAKRRKKGLSPTGIYVTPKKHKLSQEKQNKKKGHPNPTFEGNRRANSMVPGCPAGSPNE